jgi:glycosyltransferase involved in cell wall biosynthesis
MRIGFAGNANNYPFMLARALKRRDVDVRFLVTSRVRLDRPENKYPEYEGGYPDWIIDCGDVGFYRWTLPLARTRRVIHLLQQCDVVVLNQLAPTLGRRVGRPWLALLTGSDLANLANPDSPEAMPNSRNRGPFSPYRVAERYLMKRIVDSQREGIRGASTVYTFLRGLLPSYERLLDDLGIDEQQRSWVGMTDIDLIPHCPPPQNPVLRILCGARLTWVRPLPAGLNELDDKGIDVLLHGAALYAQRSSRPFELRLVRKGHHVAETRALADELGLAPFITWLDEMSQQALQREFEAADIVVDQLGPGFVGMVGMDAMATGRPVIANGRPEIFEAALGEPSPVCQAKTPDEVADQLARLGDDPQLRAEVGHQGRAYVSKHFAVDVAATRLLEHAQRALAATRSR